MLRFLYFLCHILHVQEFVFHSLYATWHITYGMLHVEYTMLFNLLYIWCLVLNIA